MPQQQQQKKKKQEQQEEEEGAEMNYEDGEHDEDHFFPPYLPPQPDRPETRPELVPFNKFTVDDRTPLNTYVNGSPRYGVCMARVCICVCSELTAAVRTDHQ